MDTLKFFDDDNIAPEGVTIKKIDTFMALITTASTTQEPDINENEVAGSNTNTFNIQTQTNPLQTPMTHSVEAQSTLASSSFNNTKTQNKPQDKTQNKTQNKTQDKTQDKTQNKPQESEENRQLIGAHISNDIQIPPAKDINQPSHKGKITTKQETNAKKYLLGILGKNKKTNLINVDSEEASDTTMLLMQEVYAKKKQRCFLYRRST